MRLTLGLLLLAAMTALSASESPIRLEIVPAEGTQDVSVRITNVSTKAIRLFEDTNMWGWCMLNLRVTLPDGKIHPLPRATSKSWSANWPSTLLLNPKDVYELKVEPFVQNYFIQRWKLKDQGFVKLSAVYAPWNGAVEIIGQMGNERRQLWLGTAESAPIPFRF